MPGTLLSENELARQLDMSRTPIRAAISRLEGEGFLETVKNRGILVKDPSYKELLDMLEVIFTFQYYQFNYQKRNLSQIDTPLLKKYLDEQLHCTSKNDYIGYVQNTLSFIRTIISGVHNAEMSKIIDGFFDRIFRFSIINYKRTPHHSHYSANAINQKMYHAILENDYETIKQTLDKYYETIFHRFSS